MPSTFSTIGRLELMATGEQAGTWGATANNNVFLLLETMVAGRLVLNVAGAADVTLTAFNGAIDQSRNRTLELTGVLTGAINVIVPTLAVASGKPFLVFNNTTGAFSLSFKTQGGTGLAIPQGSKVACYCDGTNIVQDANAIVGTFTLPTPLSVGSGGTNLATLTSHSTLVGAGTGSVSLVAPSTAGFLLTSNGAAADPSFQALAAVTSIGAAGLATGGPITATGTITVTAASKAAMQAGTDNTTAVTPVRVNDSDGAAKAWVNFTPSGGGATVNKSFNVTSVTRNGVGDYNINFTTSFTDTNYAVALESDLDGGGAFTAAAVKNGGRAAGVCRVVCLNKDLATLQDSTASLNFIFYGRQ